MVCASKDPNTRCDSLSVYFRPGDNPAQCAQGYNCPPPTLRTLDSYTPFKSRYIDVSAGGPNAFTFKATGSAPWVKLSVTSGSVSKDKPEVRIEVSADFAQVTSGVTASASVIITSSSAGQPSQSVTILVNAIKTAVSAGFKGWWASNSHI